MADLPRIFVSVASFCDPMLGFTLHSAISQASHPGRLAFGVIEQDHASSLRAAPEGAGRMAWLQIAPEASRGACWARSLAMGLYGGEAYFLQIDSHTLFEPGWDEALIADLERISARSGNPKVVLSARPFGFEIDAATGEIQKKRFTRTTLVLRPSAPLLDPVAPVMAFESRDSGSPEDQLGCQLAAGFLFTRGAFLEEVPYDPYLYFHGEEQNLSIRAFTHGWDIWHPNRVCLWHLYKSREAGEAPLHWDPAFEARRGEGWLTLRDRATARLSALLGGRLSGAYGPGRARPLAAYFEHAGLRLGTPSVSGEE